MKFCAIILISMKTGLFISLEGNEGAGKTTAAQTIVEKLQAMGHEVLYSREPGGSRIAEQIRNVLLDPENDNLDSRAEALLFAASRAQHLTEIILPALKAGKIVLCDRYVDSSAAYQGQGRGLGLNEILALNEFATRAIMPDLTLLLLVDVEEGLQRVAKRGELNRLDAQSLAFHQRVAQGYEILARENPDRITIIDASQDPEQVAAQCLSVIEKYI